jgi:hypothetical protein
MKAREPFRWKVVLSKTHRSLRNAPVTRDFQLKNEYRGFGWQRAQRFRCRDSPEHSCDVRPTPAEMGN